MDVVTSPSSSREGEGNKLNNHPRPLRETAMRRAFDIFLIIPIKQLTLKDQKRLICQTPIQEENSSNN
jgi:hypothetical protein